MYVTPMTADALIPLYERPLLPLFPRRNLLAPLHEHTPGRGVLAGFRFSSIPDSTKFIEPTHLDDLPPPYEHPPSYDLALQGSNDKQEPTPAPDAEEALLRSNDQSEAVVISRSRPRVCRYNLKLRILVLVVIVGFIVCMISYSCVIEMGIGSTASNITAPEDTLKKNIDY